MNNQKTAGITGIVIGSLVILLRCIGMVRYASLDKYEKIDAFDYTGILLGALMILLGVIILRKQAKA